MKPATYHAPDDDGPFVTDGPAADSLHHCILQAHYGRLITDRVFVGEKLETGFMDGCFRVGNEIYQQMRCVVASSVYDPAYLYQ